MKAKLLQGFHLGDVFVEPLKGSVTGREFSEHLAPKAMEVLLQLAIAPSSLVTQEALLTKVWGEDKGSREVLSHAVGELRHALHDTADYPHIIQTLPRRGYRLILEPRFPGEDEPSIVLGTRNGPGIDEMRFVQSLQHRGVLEAALAYLVLGWLLIQVADVVFSQLLLPDWAGTFVTYLVLAGFPPLAGSRWVTQSEERLIKLTLKGLHGPIEVQGAKYPGLVPMTPFGGMLSDEEIAAVLTYVRNSFGNKGGAVSASSVARVRAATKRQIGFYRPADLLRAHPHK